MAEKPFCTLRIIGTEPRSIIVFEPVGSECELLAGDALVIHVYGSSVGPEDVDADIEVERTAGRLTAWITSAEYRVWNRAGTELTHL